MKELTGNSGWIGGYTTDKDGKKNPMSLEYSNLNISVQISGQGLITLTYQELGKGFMNAHKIFTPVKILSLLYGEFSPIALKNLIDEATKS
jgi:hypothetical protein